MRMRASVAVSLLIVLACVVAATPAKAVQPGPRSYTFYDIGGSLIDCIDFKNNGKANALISGRSGKWFGAPVDALIPDPPNGFADFVGDSIYAGDIRNWFPGGFTVTRTDFHGTCETQGGASWTFVGEPFGNASCSMTSFNRYARVRQAERQLGCDSDGRDLRSLLAGQTRDCADPVQDQGQVISPLSIVIACDDRQH